VQSVGHGLGSCYKQRCTTCVFYPQPHPEIILVISEIDALSTWTSLAVPSFR